MKLLSWDGNNINDGTNYDAVLNANFQGLPGVKEIMGKRHSNWPILGGIGRPGRELNFDIYIRSGSSLELMQWFDPEDETAKQLIVEDPDGSNDRFVNAICTEFREVPFSAGLQYAVSVQVDGDVRWREIAITTASAWNLTATGETEVVANGGQDRAFPIIKISPTSGKTGAWLYKRWIPVRWNSDNFSGGKYATDIVNNSLDTDALTTAKMQADGDDLRVFVDGVEVDRWLQDMDTATTQVWVNLVFNSKQEATLDGAHDDEVTTITVNEDIPYFPSSGILHVNSETITYTGKDDSLKQFTGCTRGAKTTSAAAQGDTDAIWWVQHDIWILYGNATAATPTADDDYKPMFELDSTNASWDYDNFREDAALSRPGSWKPVVISGGGGSFYGGNQDTSATPYGELGQKHTINDMTRFIAYNPCGITNANFQNGEVYQDDSAVSTWIWWIQSSADGSTWISEYDLGGETFPSASTWTAWSRNEALTAGAIYAAIYFRSDPASGKDCCECSDVTLTIGDEPTITVGSEVSNYDLDCTITNNTTGEAIKVTYSMQLNEELEVDSDDKTVILLDDNSNEFQALELMGTLRNKWLPLNVGNNTLQFDDVGTGNVTITITWWERYFE